MPYGSVPPHPCQILLFSLWLLQHSLPWRYVQLSLRGEKKTFRAAACRALTSAAHSSWLPLPTSLSHSIHRWKPRGFPGCLGQLPAQTTGSQWETQSHSGNIKSHTVPWVQMYPLGSVEAGPQPVLQRRRVIHVLHFANIFLQSWQTECREYKYTHYIWWLAYDRLSPFSQNTESIIFWHLYNFSYKYQ